jgi:hypothetical protein
MNQAVMGAGRGQMSGQGAATLFRAFGFGAGGAGGGTEEYYNARKKMEGGIFGKGLNQGDAVKNIGAIIGRYDTETGGNTQASNLRMSDELGMGINQIEDLRKIQQKAAANGGKLDANDQKKLAALMEEQKDPMLRILDINAKMNENLAKIAGSKGGIEAVVKIDEAMLAAQEKALGFLQSIANALTGNSNPGGGLLGMGDGATAALGAAGLGAMMFPGTTGKIAKGAVSGAGSLLTRGAAMIPGIGGTLAAGVGSLGAGTVLGGAALAGGAGYLAGKYVANPLLEKYTTEVNKYGQKSDLGERTVGRVATMLPKSWGGITSEEYDDMYGMAPPGQQGGAPSGSSPEMSFQDPANTKATQKNTEAMVELTKTIARQRSAPARATNIGGSFR